MPTGLDATHRIRHIKCRLRRYRERQQTASLHSMCGPLIDSMSLKRCRHVRRSSCVALPGCTELIRNGMRAHVNAHDTNHLSPGSWSNKPGSLGWAWPLLLKVPIRRPARLRPSKIRRYCDLQRPLTNMAAECKPRARSQAAQRDQPGLQGRLTSRTQ